MVSFIQEARNVVELQRTVQRGNSLLRRKEEQLQQLQSSIADRVRATAACTLPDYFIEAFRAPGSHRLDFIV